jgi:flagellar motor component MotA
MKTLRYFISLFCALAFFILGIYASGGMLLNYVDIPSFICVVLATIAMLRSGWTFKEMGGAFKAALAVRTDRGDLEKADVFFKLMRRYLYVSGILSTFIGLIAMFKNFDDPSRFLPNLGVSFIVVFYALLLDFTVALPFGYMVRRGVKELERV